MGNEKFIPFLDLKTGKVDKANAHSFNRNYSDAKIEIGGKIQKRYKAITEADFEKRSNAQIGLNGIADVPEFVSKRSVVEPVKKQRGARNAAANAPKAPAAEDSNQNQGGI